MFLLLAAAGAPLASGDPLRDFFTFRMMSQQSKPLPIEIFPFTEWVSFENEPRLTISHLGTVLKWVLEPDLH
jgi:hypothetical protein